MAYASTNDYWSMCRGKEPFDTKPMAMRIQRRRKMHQTQVYRCDFCGKWHLGRPSDGPRGKTK